MSRWTSLHPPMQRLWQRSLTVLALTFWLGGLAFYAAVVIPVGVHVLDGHREFGFITRLVTKYLNGIAIAALLVTLPQIAISTDSRSGQRRRGLAWATMALAQGALLFMHPWLDALLDPAQHHVLDPDAFYSRHRIYLLATTLEWLAGVYLLWSLLSLWSNLDRLAATPASD